MLAVYSTSALPKSGKYPLAWSGFVFKTACSDQHLTRPLAAARSMHRPSTSFAAAGEWRNSAILIHFSSVFKLAVRRSRCDNYIPKQKEKPLTKVRGAFAGSLLDFGVAEVGQIRPWRFGQPPFGVAKSGVFEAAPVNKQKHPRP